MSNETKVDPKEIDTTEAATKDVSTIVPFRKLRVILANLDEDNSENLFCWASPVSANPLDEEGKVIEGPVGSVMIYGLPMSMLKAGTDGKSAGAAFNGFVRPRAIAGLFDYVPEESVKTILKEQGLSVDDVPEATYVAAEPPRLSRAEARKRGTAGRTLARAAKGSSKALLQLEMGTGSLEGGGDLANMVKKALEQSRQNQAE